MKTALRLLSVGLLFCGCAAYQTDRQLGQKEAVQSHRTMKALPKSLWSLREQYEYEDWESVTVFSRTLNQYRQVRFLKGKNLIISETGRRTNQTDVVEAILIPTDPNSAVSFGLYDPKSGDQLDRYPDEVVFDVEGIHDGSKAPVPGLCMACHHPKKPLNAFLIWDPDLEQTITNARDRGFGIRHSLVDPIPQHQKTLEAIEQMNQQMRHQFPNRFIDLRDTLLKMNEAVPE